MIIDASGAQTRRNPWLVVGGAGIGQAVSAQPMILTTFSLFVVPLAAATGWDRAAILGAFTVCAFGMAVGTAVVGRLLDRFPLRATLIAAWLLYCASVALISVTPQTLPLYYVPYALIGFFGAGSLIPFTKAVVGWFDNKRGTAIALMASLGGVGTTMTPLLASRLIESAGYRQAYVWMAFVALVIGLAAILPFVHARGEAPAGRKAAAAAAVPALPGLSLAEAVRTRHFWMIAVSLCLAGMAVVGVQANLVPMLVSQGISPAQATVALSVFGFASLLGRLGGILLDRFHGTLIGFVVLLLPVLGIVLILWATSLPMALAGAALIGLAFGMEIDLLAFLTSRYLGMRYFGSLLGIMQGAVILCIATGPLIVGIAYDATGSYTTVMPVLAAVLAVCALIVLMLGSYPYPPIEDFDSMVKQEAAGADETGLLSGDSGPRKQAV